jgi:hypothetical protein
MRGRETDGTYEYHFCGPGMSMSNMEVIQGLSSAHLPGDFMNKSVDSI